MWNQHRRLMQYSDREWVWHMKRLREWIRGRIVEVVGDDEKRFRLQMVWVLRIVALISLVMTVVNLLTGEYPAAILTGGFAVLGFLCTWLAGRLRRWQEAPLLVMVLAFVALLAMFIITGEPEGFSPIWICIVPPVALLLLGRMRGGLVCLTLFLMMIFLMWTPWGRSLLQYDYAEIFLTRLPLVYTGAFWVSWFLEYVREMTQKQLLETQRSLQYLYRHDALTGVMNRHGFNEHIAIAACKEHPEGLALMFIDLDDFKHTNDAYGHPAGDAVLRAMAETICRVLGDAGEVSRWGGEEFAVLMHRREGVLEMAEAVRAAIAAMRVQAGGQQVQVTVSIGLTVCNEKSIDVERLVTLTDISLYRAKKGGKNQVAWANYTKED